MSGLRYLLARHLIPICSFLATGILNVVYLRWPILESIGLPQTGALMLLNSLLVGLALYVNPNLGKDEPWLNPPPAGK